MVTIQALDEDVGMNSQVDFEFVQDSSRLSGYPYFSINIISEEANLISIVQDGVFDRENQAKQYEVGPFMLATNLTEDNILSSSCFNFVSS